MLRRKISFLPLPKLFPFARQSRRTISTPAAPMCKLQRVAALAQKIDKRTRGTTYNNNASLLPWRTRSKRPQTGGSAENNAILTEAELTELKTLVQSLTVEDFGVQREHFVNAGISANGQHDYKEEFADGAIAYIPLCDRAELTIVLFVIPPGGVMPVHDHTQMFVVSKVLWGVLDVVSFDIVRKDGDTGDKSDKIGNSDFDDIGDIGDRVLAKRRPVQVVREGEVMQLTPDVGNIHSFHAREWTAVFDVLVPPYDNAKGRYCNYYREIEPASDGNVILERTLCPDDYHTIPWPYTGIHLND